MSVKVRPLPTSTGSYNIRYVKVVIQMSVKVRLLPTLRGLDPDESVDSSNLHRANESVDSSYLRESNRSESIGSDHIRSVNIGIQVSVKVRLLPTLRGSDQIYQSWDTGQNDHFS